MGWLCEWPNIYGHRLRRYVGVVSASAQYVAGMWAWIRRVRLMLFRAHKR
jgi:hypothetical protein